MKRILLDQYLKKLLQPELFDDYCPNGLQIEGREEIKKILFSVSATRESSEHAEKIKADTLIVHHGVFWKFHGTKTLTGAFAKRVFPLIRNDINLFGFHLPLDGHLEIGNAVSVAKIIGLKNLAPFGHYKGVSTGVMGEFDSPIDPQILQKSLALNLNHSVLYSNPIEGKKTISKMGIITGGANSQWREAASLGLDAYLTGEMSEHDYHESREAGIHMFAGGHHATEKLGILSLMSNIQQEFPEIECHFIDSENPA